MDSKSMVGRKVLSLCPKCHKRVKVVWPVSEEWVREHCHYIKPLDTYAPFCSSNIVCGKCSKGQQLQLRGV